MEKKKENLFTYLLIISVITTLIFAFFLSLFFGWLTTWFPIIIALDAIIITLIITYKQHTQINDLGSISQSVLEIARHLQIDTDIAQKVTNLFPIRNSEEEYFHCYFPVQYLSSPLPLIFEGDFFALQVLLKYLKKSPKI